MGNMWGKGQVLRRFNAVRNRQDSKINLLLRASIAAVALGAGAPAQAGPASCSSNGTAIVCAGDQSAGIYFPYVLPPGNVFDVSGLTVPISPAANTSGVQLGTWGDDGTDKVEAANAADANGGAAGDATPIVLDFEGTIDVTGSVANGIIITSTGGVGGDGATLVFPIYGNGGAGGAGGNITITASPVIETISTDVGILSSTIGQIDTLGVSYGILALSTGGVGGDAAGKGAGATTDSSTGGKGGGGGIINITNDLPINVLSGGAAIGAFASGGNGGGNGAQGGAGGNGGVVVLVNNGVLDTSTSNVPMIYANAQGGDGSGRGGSGGHGGGLFITNNADIDTNGTAVSLEASGGNAANSRYAGGTARGGDGGIVSFTGASGDLDTASIGAHAILTIADGGDGGDGKDNEDDVRGGHGGDGGTIVITDSSSIYTHLNISAGLYAGARGGAGGEGAEGNDVVDAEGGNGGNGGLGGDITIVQNGNNVTSGAASPGIYAESLGGNGGRGAYAGGFSFLIPATAVEAARLAKSMSTFMVSCPPITDPRIL